MIERWRTAHEQCPACDKLVRRRKDGTFAKHKGVDRRARPGWICIGSHATAFDLYKSPSWGAFLARKKAEGRSA